MSNNEQPLLRPMRMPEDAEALARMWTASDHQWPGTVSDGVPITAQWVIDREGREKSREVMVWELGDEIAGYCSLWDWPQEPSVTYIATLNVSPGYQKLGLGRRFLQHYVERAIQIGSYRLDLHTWPGNLKAVPLYKKCGFFWMPGGGGVHMYNFLPTILTMPLTRGFFARHAWYESSVRELTQAEDDERWEGMKVFTYRFAAGGEHLTVWVDREARRVTAIETDTLFAAAIADDQDPARGAPTQIRWRVANRGAAPCQISLIASGDAALALDHRATLTVPPGETAELAAPVQVAAQVAETRQDFATPYVRSVLVVDGQVLELGTGMRPRAAVEVQSEPEHVTLTPGVAQRVELRLRSRMRHGASVSVGLTAAPGLRCDTAQASLDLPAGGFASLTIELCAEHHGVFELPVSVALTGAGGPTLLPAAVQTIFALAPGGVLAARVDDALRIENDIVRVTIEQRGANPRYMRRGGGHLLDASTAPSPPAYPNLFHETDFALSLREEGGAYVATASAESRDHPGIVMHKSVRVGAGPVISNTVELENRGGEPRSFAVRRWLGCDGEGVAAVLPLAAGLTRGPLDIFPGNPDEELRRPPAFAERWVAHERPGVVVGIVWADDLDEFQWGRVMQSRPYEIPPSGRVQTAPLHLYMGPGGWQDVRRLYQRLSGAQGDIGAPADYLRAGLERPAVVVGERGDATLLVEQRLARPLDATLDLELPAGWSAEPQSVELAAITYRAPGRAALALSSSTAPGAYEGRALLRSIERHESYPIPLLRLGDGRPVTVTAGEREGQRVLTIANGRIELDVTPDLGGTVSALRAGGVNQLATPFPAVATFSWMSPWYGGVMPVVMARGEPGFPGKVGRERFAAEPAEWADARGHVWRGVRQRAELEHEDLRGVLIEIDTLTLGGSPVVRLAMRLINAAPATRPLHEAGWLIFVRPGGAAGHTAYTPDHQERPGDRMAWFPSEGWLAAEQAGGGTTLALVSDRRLSLAGFGGAGTHFKLLPSHPLIPAGGTLEISGYLALAGDLAEARRYSALRDL